MNRGRKNPCPARPSAALSWGRGIHRAAGEAIRLRRAKARPTRSAGDVDWLQRIDTVRWTALHDTSGESHSVSARFAVCDAPSAAAAQHPGGSHRGLTVRRKGGRSRVMTVHVLHAGDGYTYLTRQVASGDVARRRGEALTDYYTADGNPPGRWVGSGRAAMDVHGLVSEAQMKALFGEGVHPDAQARIQAAVARGMSVEQAEASVRLGRRFPVIDHTGEVWRERLDAAYEAFHREHGRRPERGPERDLIRWTVATRAVPGDPAAGAGRRRGAEGVHRPGGETAAAAGGRRGPGVHPGEVGLGAVGPRRRGTSAPRWRRRMRRPGSGRSRSSSGRRR